MATTLNLSAQQNSSGILNLGGEIPSTYIAAAVASIVFTSSATQFAGYAFPVSNIEATPWAVSVKGSQVEPTIVWTGKTVSGVISLRHDNINVYSRAPVKITANTGNIAVLASSGLALYSRRIFPPFELFPGYAFDGANLVIPISALPGFSAAAADAVTGDSRALIQAILVRADDALNHAHPVNSSPVNRPRTVVSFMLEDWNRNDARFGRHMKRLFLVEFTVENSPTNVFNSGE